MEDRDMHTVLTQGQITEAVRRAIKEHEAEHEAAVSTGFVGVAAFIGFMVVLSCGLHYFAPQAFAPLTDYLLNVLP
jgi:hypothetical protein